MAETDTGDTAAVAEETDAMSVGELEDSVFDDIETSPEGEVPEPKLEAIDAPTSTLAAETKETTAEPETKPEPAEPEAATTDATEAEGDTTPSAPAAFDYETFAKEYGVKDADLFKNCSGELDALKALGKRHNHFSSLYGEQSATVGELRRQLEAATAAQAATEASDAGEAIPTPSEWTEEERQSFLQEFDEAPEKALAKYMPQALASGLTPEDVQAQVEAGISKLQVDREKEEMEAKHPGWQARWPEMNAVVADLGTGGCPPYEECYELAGLRNTEPDAYGLMVGKMRSGVSYWDARILCIEHPAAASGKTPTAASEAQTRAEAARELGGGGKGGKTKASPRVETDATSVAELEFIGEDY